MLKEFFDLAKSMGLTPREHKMEPEWLDLAMAKELAKTAGEQLKHIQAFVKEMHQKKGEEAPRVSPSGETEVSPRGVGFVVGQGNVVQKPEVITTPFTQADRCSSRGGNGYREEGEVYLHLWLP